MKILSCLLLTIFSFNILSRSTSSSGGVARIPGYKGAGKGAPTPRVSSIADDILDPE